MDWTHRFHNTFYYREKSSISDGDITHGSWTSAVGRVEQYHTIVKSTGGQEALSSHRVATTVAIDNEAQVDITGSSPSDATNALRILRRDIATTLDNAYTLYIYTLGR